MREGGGGGGRGLLYIYYEAVKQRSNRINSESGVSSISSINSNSGISSTRPAVRNWYE